MNAIDRLLIRTPASDDTWHCPWFRLIEFFSANGVIFGLLAYLLEGVALGLFAAGVGTAAATFSIGARFPKGDSC